MPLTAGSITINSNATNTPASPPGNASTADNATVQKTVTWASGTGISQANRTYRAEVDVEVGTPVTIDLRSLTGPFGEAISFGAVKQISIENFVPTGSTIGTLTVDTSDVNGWVGAIDGTVSLVGGAAIVLLNPSAAGWTVGASTNDIILTATTSNCTNVRILVIGNAS